MIHTQKWREPLTDPMKTIFPCGMKVLEILGYPHAGNDVFGCRLEFKGEVHKAVLKISRHIDANLEKEWRTINLLQGKGIDLPQIITDGHIEGRVYIATKYDDGKRLSQILKEYEVNQITEESLKHMYNFGANLGKIHSLEIDGEKVLDRRFHHLMSMENSKELGLEKITEWLQNNAPRDRQLCFIHGDHHYANILWKDYNITTTLDWELSGLGWREFDIAWALILRPAQAFMKTQEERNKFLEGYRQHSTYKEEHLKYCMVMIYQYFYGMGKQMNDIEYTEFVMGEMLRLIN